LRQAFRRAALQGAASQVAPLIVIWQNTSTEDLIGHLQDVVAANNIAAAEALRNIFNQRPHSGEQSMRFARTLQKLNLPIGDARHRLGNVKAMAASIDSRIQELLRGKRTPYRLLNDIRSGSIGRRA
jgi:hypothetical protein